MDEISKTVTSVSDGTVTIAVEKYQELLAAAAEKAPVIYRTIQKTPEMVAGDNKMWGAVFLGGGVALSTIGGIMLKVGLGQAKGLKS